MLLPEIADRDASLASSDIDTSEVHPSTEASSSGMSGVPLQNGRQEKNTSLMDDSSSTCSSDSLPSVVLTRPAKWSSLPNGKSLKLSSRGKNRRGKGKRDQTGSAIEPENQPAEPVTRTEHLNDATGSCRTATSESHANVLSLKDLIQCPEHQVEKQEVGVFPLQKKLDVKDRVEVKSPSKQRMAAQSFSSPSSPSKNPPPLQPKQVTESTVPAESDPVRESSSISPKQTEKNVPWRIASPKIPAIHKPEAQKPTPPSKPIVTLVEKPSGTRVSVMSRPSSAPLFPAPKPSPAIVSIAQTSPILARSASAAGRLDNDSPATQSFVPQSYQNAIMGENTAASSSTFIPSPSISAINLSPVYPRPPLAVVSSPTLSQQSSTREDQNLGRAGFTFGPVSQDVHQNRPQFLEECSTCDPSLLSDIQKLDINGGCSSGDEFPHLDIINYLLDDDQNIGRANAVFQSSNNYELNRHYTFSGNMATMSGEVIHTINSCRHDRTSSSYFDDGIGMQRLYGSCSSGPFDEYRDLVPQVSILSSSSYGRNEQIDGLIQNHQQPPMLQMRNTDGNGLYSYNQQIPEYSTATNLVCRVDGSTVFQPTNGH